VPKACPVSKSAIFGGYTTVTLNRLSTVQNTWKTSLSYWPDVLSPGLEVNLATSTILTANCCAVCRWIHRLTTLNGPLQQTWRHCSEHNNAPMKHKQCTQELSCHQTACAIREKTFYILTQVWQYFQKIRILINYDVTEGLTTMRNESFVTHSISKPWTRNAKQNVLADLWKCPSVRHCKKVQHLGQRQSTSIQILKPKDISHQVFYQSNKIN
jgi:hypothetical protein